LKTSSVRIVKNRGKFETPTTCPLNTSNGASDHAKKTLAISTLRNERTVLNQIFRFAKRKGYISDPPVIAIPLSRQNSPPDISETEWRTLYTYLRKYVKEAQDKRRYRERFYLQHYILILANSGIRVGEARHLRWRDISSTSPAQPMHF
jgi:integrase